MPFSLGSELSSGITVGLIALPLSLALGMASIPEGTVTPLPIPALGILTAIISGFIISCLGGSRVQIGGPTAAFIPIILMIVSEHGYGGLLVSTIMAGCFLILLGITGLGSMVKYIPWPVTSGFTTGIAVSIVITQLPGFFGFRSQGDPMPREFIERLEWMFQHLPSLNPAALGIGAACLGLILFWPRLKIKGLPGSMAAILLASAVVQLFGWSETLGVQTIARQFGAEAIPQRLPFPHVPEMELSLFRELLGPALAIAILGAIESLLSAVVADGLSGDQHDSNTELIAQGVANIVCPFFGGLPATGAIARTSANIHHGGKTPISGMIHALTLLGIVLLGATWAGYIPLTAMAAVLMAVAFRMGEWHELRRIRKIPASDALVMLCTFLLTVVFDLVIAIEVGMVLAALLFIRRVSEGTQVSQLTARDLEEQEAQRAAGIPLPKGVVVFQIFGPFLFGAVEKLEDALSQLGETPSVLILRMQVVTTMDATGLNALTSVVERLQAKGGTVILCGAQPIPLRMLTQSGLRSRVGELNLTETYTEAVSRAESLMQESVA